MSDLARKLAGARRVVFLCGAGLSVPSGIRAYRSGPNGAEVLLPQLLAA